MPPYCASAGSDFWLAVLAGGLAIAGAMVGKKSVPPGPGTFPTHGALFSALLVAAKREVALGGKRLSEPSLPGHALGKRPWGPRPGDVVYCGIEVLDLHAVKASRRRSQ